MCGISGVFSKKSFSREKISSMIKALSHRGPDDSDYKIYGNIALGSCRLSIFDLSSKGRMPLEDVSKRFSIVFNGEIYNFNELKRDFNIKTISKTDTEVLLELYKLKGTNCLNYLNGMFSFVIYDFKKNILFCARDRLGIKPFYYYYDEKNFIFSSEIKPITQYLNSTFVDEDYLSDYLNTGLYDYNKRTFFKNINQLEPGHYILKSDTEFKKIRYWDLYEKNLSLSLKKLSFEDVKRIFFDTVKNSFKLQMQSDTQIGLNVSSGLDSQIMMKNLHELNNGQGNITANSYYFDEAKVSEKDELEKFAKQIGWKIDYMKISPKIFLENIKEVVESQGEPFPGIPTFAKYYLIKKNYNKNCKVILEAQGGDDFSAGYRYTFPFYLKDLLKSGALIKSIKEINCFLKNEDLTFKDFIPFYINCIGSLKTGGISSDGSSFLNKEILNQKIRKKKIGYKFDFKKIKSNLNKILYRDINKTKLPRILRSCDRASMSNGKELRVPLLDHNIVEFCYSLPTNYKIWMGNLRYFYRATYFDKYKNKVFFKPKKHVSDPQTIWLKGQLHEWANDIFNSKKFNDRGLFNVPFLLKKFKLFKNDKNQNNSFLFWQAINVELWYRTFIDKN